MKVFDFASLVGSMAFALSGFMIGVRKRFDIMGVFILAMLTANGGGAVRDVMIGDIPKILQDEMAFYTVIGTFLLGFFIYLHKPAKLEQNTIFIVSDSVGLAAFSLTGALIGIEHGLSIFGVMVLAFVTATGGGIIRDILVNEVPTLLSQDFYGTVALLMAACLHCLYVFDYQSEITLLMVFCAGLAIRLIAYYRKWHLPSINFKR